MGSFKVISENKIMSAVIWLSLVIFNYQLYIRMRKELADLILIFILKLFNYLFIKSFLIIK